jgi:hypothetical protein
LHAPRAQAELRRRTKQLKALLSELNMEAAVTDEKKAEVAHLQARHSACPFILASMGDLLSQVLQVSQVSHAS